MDIIRGNLIESSQGNIREHYRFQQVTLGEGSYGFVRVGIRLGDNSKRAIKIIPKKRIKRPEILTRQIEVMKMVDHPNIVKLYQTFEDSRYLYLVMQLCEGGQLFDKLIEMGHFTQHQAATLFFQMLSSVAYMHHRNLAHRDLKPENFLFGNSRDLNSLKLIDFGLAKTVNQHTKLTTKTGTCYYVSPETLQGNYNEKCDIWSLGVILFMMLSGYPPFDGKNDRQIIENVKHSQFTFGESIWRSVSPVAKDLITRMFDRNPQTRISAEQALQHPWVTGHQRAAEPVQISLNQLESYQTSNKFRKTVLNFMATQCTTSELSDIVSLFQSIDTNHDGTLSISEIRDVLARSETISRETIQEVINAIDIDRSGSIDLTEFLAAMLDRRVYLNQQKLWLAFKRFDIDNSGQISPEELREVIDKDHTIQDPQIWREMIQEVDLDGDGFINYEEFVKMMEKASQEEVNNIRRRIN